jgi:hypothetical protein
VVQLTISYKGSTMINKLISNIPFNPSLVEELSSYSKRLRKERSIRKIGFVMIILSLLVQVMAANIPAEKSLAASDNDIIRGGVTTKKDILNAWDNPATHVADIYGKFGLSRKDIADIPGNKPNARIRSDSSNFWSAGRSPLTGYSNITQQYKDKEIAISTPGPTVFLRPLRAWDGGGGSSVYEAFRGRNSTTGETFWILADCGNYTQNGPGRLPPPKLQVNKTIVDSNGSVKPGGLIKFRIEYRNRQQDSLAEDVKIIDNLQREKFDIVSPGNLSIGPNNKMVESVGNLRYTDNSYILDITVKAKSNLRNGTRICNSVRLTSSNAEMVSAGGAPATCVRINRTSQPALTAAAAPTVTTSTTSAAATAAARGIMPPGLTKQVRNITQNLNGENALQSKVRAGDIHEYTLVTYNGSNQPVTGYVVKDFIGDVTDYADVDYSFLREQGGTYDKQAKEIIWTNQQINPRQGAAKKFRVRIKNPLPSTNKPSTASTNFDCKISNEYGNELTMNVQCPAAKVIETLPNTGPRSAVMITFGIASFSGYFLARNGLLSKEIFILRRTYGSAGGNK